MKLKTSFDIVKYSPLVQHFSSGGVQGGTGPPNVNLGPPKISETTRARMLKLKTVRYCEVLALSKNISPLRVRSGGVRPPSVNLGPPNISESKRPRKKRH